MNITTNGIKICNKVLREIETIKGNKILDLGGGARDSYYKEHSNKEIICIDLQDADIIHDLNNGIPFEDNTIDGIIIANLLQHLDSPFNFMKECKRVLKDNGKIILITPNSLSLVEIMIHYGKRESNDLNYNHRIYLWNRSLMHSLIKRAGFNIEKFELFECFWNRNYLLKLLVWLIPILRPQMFYILRKEKQ